MTHLLIHFYLQPYQIGSYSETMLSNALKLQLWENNHVYNSRYNLFIKKWKILVTSVIICVSIMLWRLEMCRKVSCSSTGKLFFRKTPSNILENLAIFFYSGFTVIFLMNELYMLWLRIWGYIYASYYFILNKDILPNFF